MGNRSSTRWKRGYRKLALVEECASIDVNDWARQGYLVSGKLTAGVWCYPPVGGGSPVQYRGVRGLIGYTADLRQFEMPLTASSTLNPEAKSGANPVLRFWLSYQLVENSASLDYPITLEIWPCRFGGFRFWFHCPLCLGQGLSQEPRRCMQLYLPPGEMRFGCRGCHGLTYRKCQGRRHAPRPVPLVTPEMDIALHRVRNEPFSRDLDRQISRVVRSIY